MPTGSTYRYAVNRLQPAYPSPEATPNSVKLPPNANLLAGTVLGVATAGTPASAVHTLTFTGTVTGGTFRLFYGPDSTAAVAWSGTAATLVANLQAAMDATFGAGNTVVTGTGPYVVTFQNGMANLPIPVPTVLSGLTGTSPVLTPTLTTAGVMDGAPFDAYNAAASDTALRVARAVLIWDTVTDSRGRWVGDRPAGAEATGGFPVYQVGPFRCADLVGLDATALASFGRLINATAVTDAGAVIYIR